MTIVLVTGCGQKENGGVVATTPVVADLVRNVAGSDIAVSSLLPPNSDPHEYEPRPSDVVALGKARLVVRSGGDLDSWLNRAIKSAGHRRTQINLIDSVLRLKDGRGGIDPHWWHDPRNVESAVRAIAAGLRRIDPTNERQYTARAATYMRRVAEIDNRIEQCISSIPVQNRKLVTTHNALGYYARRYRISVVGSILPSASTSAEPSAGTIAQLISRMKSEHVAVVFAEQSLNSKLERSVANATGAREVGGLLTDGLAPRGHPGSTYLGALAVNTQILVKGLTNGTVKCTLPD